jgi:hypothetical protein
VGTARKHLGDHASADPLIRISDDSLCWEEHAPRAEPYAAQVYKAVLGGVQTVAVKMLGGQQDHAAQVKFCREVAILRSCRWALRP